DVRAGDGHAVEVVPPGQGERPLVPVAGTVAARGHARDRRALVADARPYRGLVVVARGRLDARPQREREVAARRGQPRGDEGHGLLRAGGAPAVGVSEGAGYAEG